MRFTEEDLAKANAIIEERYHNGFIPGEDLGNLAILLSKACIRENGFVMNPSKNSAIRVIAALGYEIR